MINYILQVILFQVLFLAIYDFFLSKETFFTKNRWYLLSIPILSFLIPFIKIPTFQKAIPQEFIIYLPEIVLSPEKIIQDTTFYQSINYVNILFLVGVSLFAILFLIKLIKIFNLIRKSEIEKKKAFTLVLIPHQTKAFSFFHFIFLGKEIPVSQQNQIIAHEFVHSKQKHSFDLLFFEMLKIVMWFNPMIYFYQKRITLIHEYISDQIVVKSASKETYINNLLSNFFQVENIAFVNQFYRKTLIKKRIIMMKKTQSKKRNQLKYLVIIPVLASMLFYVGCTTEDLKEEPQSKEERIKELLEELNSLRDKEPYVVTTESRKETVNYSDEVSFMIIDKAPTFPGCEEGDKKCFSNMIQKHFIQNFDSDLPNTLGLASGRKKIYIGFKVDKEGNVVDVQARAPHEEIKKEVLKVMNRLPKMIPGEHKGEKVGVKYSIPFVIVVK
ncbi:BlaR1 peptidase M56 [Polaribacter sp. MSW13]|uniref:BlaR1 peptidase M56 n=1 Tax=Polaribacter marinus TaxID=2916838 RepID=A0A9X1VST8_9FLAO|nr:M56 family metallopeptidase [Polaribacter marinus]MCI2230170.1 BlaR1 peptidase M56 [Polaribacter marinus]